MGRKIPSKKHRGVKDPLEQQARKMQSLKGKINAPPKDPDEQPIPRSLERLFAFKDRNLDEKRKKRKKIIRENSTHVAGRSLNPLAKMKKLPGESGRSFSMRINNAIKSINDPRDEQDFPDDHELDMEDAKGERMAALRERRRRKRPTTAEPQLTRTQKRALKEKLKKESVQQQQQTRQEVVYERVGFGDVTHAPPTLSVKPRHCNADGTAARPGRRDLLLSSLLLGGAGTGANPSPGAAELQRRERARLDAVAAYRALKKQNRERDKRTRAPRTHNIAI